uniref:Ufm1-specific protease n=1 Tax=Dracunculus medinensis TaxID=318479 RepID=A0A0N4U8B1_DRAME
LFYKFFLFILANCRLKFHRIFNLPLTKPLLKLSQAFKLGLQTNLLRSPHLSINKYKAKGELSIIQGAYNYHHYMQDGINDNGWGCAYRSFQTIWSFFLIQGYTDKQVPSHREIQQSLHDCGDKDAKFVGSRQWIGSLELSYCLENMLNITSRIIALNSGAEIVDNARQIGLHFKTNGTPIMIGGGMLAYTILGVDFNEITGDCAFLVLDPHYTGDEIIDTVISKGWCGWKPPSFWKSEHFYNLLLPDLPKNFI